MTTGPYSIRSENKVKSLLSKQAFEEGQILSTIPNENLYHKPTRYTVQIGRTLHTEVAHLSALNHSCDPNVILDTQRMLVIARRDIRAGDELTFFYPSTEWE
ncbi:MAG: SET domain-containing protein-lysine N-methyltransferase, partial [Candidatus Binatia bacterium]